MPWHKFAEGELLCPVCLGLIVEPTTAPACGHSFCRNCLVQSFQKTNQRCPACRHTVLAPPESLPINITLRNIAQKLFPQEYATREAEAQRERAVWGAKLPLFTAVHATNGDPGQLAFPGLTLSLHLHAPTYRHRLDVMCAARAAAAAASAAGGGGGAPPSVNGSGSDGRDHPAVGSRFGFVATAAPEAGVTVGVIAVISDVRPVAPEAGGGFLVAAKCVSRFRVLEVWDEPLPLPIMRAAAVHAHAPSSSLPGVPATAGLPLHTTLAHHQHTVHVHSSGGLVAPLFPSRHHPSGSPGAGAGAAACATLSWARFEPIRDSEEAAVALLATEAGAALAAAGQSMMAQASSLAMAALSPPDVESSGLGGSRSSGNNMAGGGGDGGAALALASGPAASASSTCFTGGLPQLSPIDIVTAITSLRVPPGGGWTRNNSPLQAAAAAESSAGTFPPDAAAAAADQRASIKARELALAVWRNFGALRVAALQFLSTLTPVDVARLTQAFGPLPLDVTPGGASRLSFWLVAALPLPGDWRVHLHGMSSLGERMWVLLQVLWDHCGRHITDLPLDTLCEYVQCGTDAQAVHSALRRAEVSQLPKAQAAACAAAAVSQLSGAYAIPVGLGLPSPPVGPAAAAAAGVAGAPFGPPQYHYQPQQQQYPHPHPPHILAGVTAGGGDDWAMR